MADRNTNLEPGTWMRGILPQHLKIESMVFLVSLIAGFIIRLYLAFTAPINMDENFYAFDGHLLENGLTPFQDFPTRSPLMIIISAAILRMGGDFYALRTAAVICSIATGILVFHAGRIMGGQRIGSLAAALYFLSPYSIRYGYVFFTQPFEAFCVGLSFTLLVRWVSAVHGTVRETMGERGERGGNRVMGNINQDKRTTIGGNMGGREKNRGGGDINQDKRTTIEGNMEGRRKKRGGGDFRGMFRSLRENRSLIISGLILGCSVFIRRNALAFFPAGFLILCYYQYISMREDGHRSRVRDKPTFIPQMAFSLGFFLVLIPGVILFMTVSGLSYTTYFFYSDYIQTHTSVVWNISFSLLYFDTRGYHFISSALLFITVVLLKLPDHLSSGFHGWGGRAAHMKKVLHVLLLLGWALVLFCLLGNNYANANGGLFYGIGLLLIFLLAVGSSVLPVYLMPRQARAPFPIPVYIFATFASCLLILASREEFFFAFDAVILLNVGSIALFMEKEGHLTIRMEKRSQTGFPSPLVALSIFLFCILLFYLMFRVILPYFYDLLFPISIITAFIVIGIADSMRIDTDDLLRAGKAVFICTLLLSFPISMAEYHYGDIKLNETDIGEFEECVTYLRDHAEPKEEIFTAKALIPLQAGLENIFNIVRPAPYLAHDTDLLERMDYPSVHEIVEYLHQRSIRFIVVDWVMRHYFLNIYPELDGYVDANYHQVGEFGSIRLLMRN